MSNLKENEEYGLAVDDSRRILWKWTKRLALLGVVGYAVNFGYVHLVPKYQFSFKEGEVVCRCNRFTGKVERLNLTRGWAKNTGDWHAYEE